MMNVIWRQGPCTVAQVREALKPERELAYTSVSTIIRILEQKGYVRSERAGRGHRYSARMPLHEYQAMSLKSIVRDVFNDEPTLVVQHLLESRSLKPDEIEEIRALLRPRGGGK